jgi:cyanophycinase
MSRNRVLAFWGGIGVAGLMVFGLIFLSPGAEGAKKYKYFRIGSNADSTAAPTFGIAMMGGGKDLDEAFKWLCDLGNGGDFLIIRSRGDDDYNPYVNQLCHANSVATLILPDHASAEDKGAAEIIGKAEVLFIAGGDQAHYLHDWTGTPVNAAINEHIAAGKPIGGTSAGLAVQGQFAFGAFHDTAISKDVLADPYSPEVTLVRDYLRIALLDDTITDSHFAKRDRMGRSLVFLARIMKDGWSAHPREIAIDERSAVLVNPDGSAVVVGSGLGAFFMKPTEEPEICEQKKPLTMKGIAVYRGPMASHFDLRSWEGTGGESYTLNVEDGVIHSTQKNDDIY